MPKNKDEQKLIFLRAQVRELAQLTDDYLKHIQKPIIEHMVQRSGDHISAEASVIELVKRHITFAFEESEGKISIKHILCHLDFVHSPETNDLLADLQYQIDNKLGIDTSPLAARARCSFNIVEQLLKNPPGQPDLRTISDADAASIPVLESRIQAFKAAWPSTMELISKATHTPVSLAHLENQPKADTHGDTVRTRNAFFQRVNELTRLSTDDFVKLSAEVQTARQAVDTFMKEIETEMKEIEPWIKTMLVKPNARITHIKQGIIFYSIYFSYDQIDKDGARLAQSNRLVQGEKIQLLAQKYSIALDLARAIAPREGSTIPTDEQLTTFRDTYNNNRATLELRSKGGMKKFFEIVDAFLSAVGQLIGWKSTLSQDWRGKALAKTLGKTSLASNRSALLPSPSHDEAGRSPADAAASPPVGSKPKA